MGVVGIIAEYDPFHNGHLAHLTEALGSSGENRAVIVMSGPFTQRGEPALVNKHVRARMALCHGASVVIELPAAFACAGAEAFARGGVGILDAIGVTERLCFGAETEDLGFLRRAASILAVEPSAYRDALRAGLSSGLSFPKARFAALAALLPESDAPLLPALRLPNNILALEYLSAMEKTGSAMSPMPILRKGAGHNAEAPQGGIASASYLRGRIRGGEPPESLARLMPTASLALLAQEAGQGALGPTMDDYSLILHYIRIEEKFKHNVKNNNELHINRESDSLLRRMASRGDGPVRVTDLLDRAATPRFTRTRLRRAIARRLIGLPEENAPEVKRPLYARVLGFRRDDAEVLSGIVKSSSIPVVVNLKHAGGMLDAEAMAMLRQDLFAQELWRMGGGRGAGDEALPLVIL